MSRGIKPHPTFSTGLVHALKTSPKLRGFDLRILDTDPLMEEFLLHYKPAFISSVFSTGLATAREMFGINAYAYETQSFLQRLRPYENSNRIPAALIHYAFRAFPNSQIDMPLETLQTKIDILAAGMQPKLLAETLEDQARLLGQPEDEGDLIEGHARERISRHTPRTAPSFLRLAIQGRSAEEGALCETDDDRAFASPEAKERPLEKAQRLLKTGRVAEAFTVSAKALRETPTSSRHLKVLETASAKLGGLYQHQYDRIRLTHESAVAKQKTTSSNREANHPLQTTPSGLTGPSAPETTRGEKKTTGGRDINRPSFWSKIRR